MSYNYLAQSNRHINDPFRRLGPLNKAIKEALGQYKNQWVFDHLTNQEKNFLKTYTANNNKAKVAEALKTIQDMGKRVIDVKFPNRVNRTKTQNEINANRAKRGYQYNDYYNRFRSNGSFRTPY